MTFKSFVFYLLRTLADIAEKEQQIKGLKTDVLEKDKNITGEKKCLSSRGISLSHGFYELCAVSVLHTCVFGVKYIVECLAVLYQVFRMRWEDKKSRFMRWRRIFPFSRKSLIRQSKPGRTAASRCRQHSFKPFLSVSISYCHYKTKPS